MLDYSFSGVRLGPIPINANQHEWPILEMLNQQLLVWKSGNARPAPRCPEHQENYLATIAAQLHTSAIQVFTFNLGRRLTDAQMPKFIQLPARFATESGC